jgi:hypothetical protein
MLQSSVILGAANAGMSSKILLFLAEQSDALHL